jgi:hypothetical protein
MIANLDSNAGRVGKARMAPVARRVPSPPAIAPLDDNVALRERNYLAEVWGRLRQYPKPKGLDPCLEILKLRLKRGDADADPDVDAEAETEMEGDRDADGDGEVWVDAVRDEREFGILFPCFR